MRKVFSFFFFFFFFFSSPPSPSLSRPVNLAETNEPTPVFVPGYGFIVQPVAPRDITGVGYSFGDYRPNAYSGHWGHDFLAEMGSPVRVAHNGKIVFAGWDGDRGGRGWTVRILDEESGIGTVYGHLQDDPRLSLSIGDAVTAGELIGRIGSSGRSALPHLHFELVLRNQDGEWFNVDHLSGRKVPCGPAGASTYWNWLPGYEG